MSNLLEVDAGLNCSICLELFRQPKILPRCGHTFCFECLEKIQRYVPRREIVCPECRSWSSIGALGLTTYKTNYALQKAVEFIKSANAPSAKGCIHSKLTRNPITCQHCNSKFCSGCITAHVEELRLESIWVASSVVDRVRRLENEFSPEEAKQVIENETERLKDEIKEQPGAIEARFTSILEKRCEELLKMVEKTAEYKREQLESYIKLSEKSSLESIESNLKHLNDQSVLVLSMKDVSEKHAALTKYESQVANFEELKSGFIGISRITLLEAYETKLSEFSEINPESLTLIDDCIADSCRGERHRFQEAIETNDLETAKQILTRENFPPSVKNYLVHSKTLDMLKKAAEQGDLDMVRTICPNDMKVCSEALEAAISSGSLSAVDHFLHRFPELASCKRKDGDTPFDLAFKKGNVALALLIADKMSSSNESSKLLEERASEHFCNAIDENNLESVKFFVERDSSILTSHCFLEKFGVWPIHRAVRSNQSDVPCYLLEKYPEGINQPEEDLNMPLHLAAIRGNLELVKKMAECYGANVNAENADGETCLHLAASYGFLAVVKYLVESTAILIEATTEHSQNALHCAIHHPDVVAYLLEKAKELSLKRDKDDRTPLSLAMQKQRWKYSPEDAAKLRESIRIMEEIKLSD